MPTGIYKHKPLSEITKTKIREKLKGKMPKYIPSNLGKHLKEETKIKIGNANRGKKHTEEWKIKASERMKGNKHGLGYKYSNEIKKQRSINWTGKNNPNWKNGITPENHKIRTSIEFNLWREAVFARDNWTCQKTRIKGGKLHSHHIYNFADYPELRTSIENGITLSDKSHKQFHHIYGIKNNTKEQLDEFLNNNI